MEEENKPLTIDQVAQVLGIQTRGVAYLCRKYQKTKVGLHCVKIGDGVHTTYVMFQADVDVYLLNRVKRGPVKGSKRMSVTNA